MSEYLINACERRWVPDAVIRLGMRRLLAQRLRRESHGHPQARNEHERALMRELACGPIAVGTEAANEQHYELPAAFFECILGRHCKYSSGYWPDAVSTLDEAEATMLALSCERAELENGHKVLELGCGWGALTLWMAARYPDSDITAVSNSISQGRFIEARARERGLDNVHVITADMNTFAIDPGFDRLVSMEMFEHMRNYALLMRRIAGWLRPGGKLFVHVFCHREYLYPFEDSHDYDWIARHFFTGGVMPSAATLLHFQQALRLEEQWLLSGTHYERTANAWLDNLDASAAEALDILVGAYGKERAPLWLQRWRMFFMACAELSGYRDGSEWMVAHYRFQRPLAP